MGTYKRGVFLLTFLTVFYGLIAVLFYFNGFGGLIGGTFFGELKLVEGIGNDIPLAVAVGLTFLWLLLGATYVVNQKSTSVEDYETENVKKLVAATKEAGTNQKTATKNTNMKMVLYVLGFFIFGGLLLISMIDASFYIKKYSSYTLWEFRLSTLLVGILYFLIVFFKLKLV